MALSTIGPIDYSSLIQAPDLGGTLLQGFQAGAGIRQAIDERELQRQAMDQQEQYKVDLQSALSNPTPQAFAALTAKYPQQREAFKQSWEMLDKGQQDAEFKSGAQVYSALRQNKPEIALQELQKTIDAHANSGEDTADLENIKRLIQSDPKAASGHIGLVLSSIDPDRWGKIAGELRESDIAPAKLSEAQAKAYKAGVDAKYADSMAAKGLEKLGWDIWKIGQDASIARQNSQISALNAATARESNNLKKQELQVKLDEKIKARDDAVRQKADEAQTGADTLNHISGLLGEILGDEDSLRAASGGLGFRGLIPGTDARSMAGKIDQLRDTLASANLDKLKGPMSDKDVEFLRRLSGNLDRYQDEDQLIKELNRLNEFLPNSMDKLNSKYGSSFTLQKNPQGVANDTGAPPPGAVRRIN